MIEAIVLRFNSHGGTPAAAREIIRNLDYAKSKKPVVVSMGDRATSAADYVSVYADRIYANPDTFIEVSRWMEREGYNISTINPVREKIWARFPGRSAARRRHMPRRLSMTSLKD